jgi:hypothetical protein
MLKGVRLASVIIVAAACGDSGGDTVTASGTSTSPGTSSSGEPTTSGVSDSEATPTTGMGGSMSMGTTGPEPGTTSTGQISGTDSSGGESSAGETGPGLCARPDLSPGAVPVDPTCTIDEMVGTFTPVIEWQNNTLGVTYTTPAIANLTDDNADGVIDGSDVPDLAVITQAGKLHVLSGDGSGQHWASVEVIGFEPSAATIADLDGDARPEVVVSGTNGVFAYHGDGALMWMNPNGGSMTVCGATSVYDMTATAHPTSSWATASARRAGCTSATAWAATPTRRTSSRRSRRASATSSSATSTATATSTSCWPTGAPATRAGRAG